ncbi:hypothetical protein BDF14DRAFT_156129 [Spinellus fusiger]|nr:hypothetical protein BDF14DRAFT_156129 [Spinellus fusiger]
MPPQKLTKAQQVSDLLGKRISVTRKIKLETILRPEYRTQLTNRIINMSSKLRDVMVRSQFFVNYYILCQNDQPVNNKIYTQNFWYSVPQLVLNKTNQQKQYHLRLVYFLGKPFSQTSTSQI